MTELVMKTTMVNKNWNMQLHYKFSWCNSHCNSSFFINIFIYVDKINIIILFVEKTLKFLWNVMLYYIKVSLFFFLFFFVSFTLFIRPKDRFNFIICVTLIWFVILTNHLSVDSTFWNSSLYLVSCILNNWIRKKQEKVHLQK